ncbi:PPE domain-containing protein [Mycobacterium stomatepiae]|nr:PPE domain-containing protein [Mycobacterium stomatepiae]
MDFALAPEINSARIYAGPGSAPMRAAATAWGNLAEDLYSMACFCQSAMSELTDSSWDGMRRRQPPQLESMRSGRRRRPQP